MVGALYHGSQRETLLAPETASLGTTELIVFGSSYKTASLDFRERLAKLFSLKGLEKVRHLPGLKESALLSTCNRLELYLVTDSPDLTNRVLAETIGRGLSPRHGRGSLFALSGLEAVTHLFRVAAGLDSVVPGEPQILSQVRSAGIASRKAGSAGGILSPLFDRASRVGARVRDTYGIGSGAASLSDLAVETVLRSVRMKPNVLLVGTGKMVQLAAKHLQGKARRFYVASSRRRVPKGLEGSILVSYRDISKTAEGCDVVISATSADEPLLSKEDLAGRRRRIVVDLGMPRNVSPAARSLPNVRLIDLDDLAKMARPSKNSEGTRDAEAAVAREASEFYAWLVQTRLSSTLSQLFAWANGLREEEFRRAMRKLGQTSARDRRVIEAMGRRIVSKMMARPAGFARRKYGGLTEEEKLELLRSVFRADDTVEDEDPSGN